MCKPYLDTNNLKKDLFINDRYYTHYKKNVCLDLIYKQNLPNIFEIPKIKKITLNFTYKAVINDKKSIIPALVSLQLISGQKLKLTIAHKSIAGFKIRKNQLIGCKADLRNMFLYNFLEKLITIILPRIRNFNGIKIHYLDEKAHVSVGIPEILVFFELENYFEFFELLKGLDITIVTNVKKNKNSNFSKVNYSPISVFLSAFQFPIK